MGTILFPFWQVANCKPWMVEQWRQRRIIFHELKFILIWKVVIGMKMLVSKLQHRSSTTINWYVNRCLIPHHLSGRHTSCSRDYFIRRCTGRHVRLAVLISMAHTHARYTHIYTRNQLLPYCINELLGPVALWHHVSEKKLGNPVNSTHFHPTIAPGCVPCNSGI